MSDLEDFQFDLDGYVFGIGAPVSVDGEGFDQGVDDFTVQDVANSYNDSLSFGRDSVTPALWAWAAHTDEALNARDALAAARALGAVWNDQTFRRTPGAVKALRYCLDGQTWVVFGRPRSFGQVMSNQILSGMIPINLEFQRVDALHYGDDVLEFDVANASASTDGFTAPITTPLVTIEGTPTTSSLGPFDGDTPAPFEATFTGPATNPKLYTDDWELQLNVTLEPGESMTVSTYPWGPRVIRDDGVRIPGLLSINSRLAKARLRPTGESLRFSAIDSTGDASCRISWRAAHSTI